MPNIRRAVPRTPVRVDGHAVGILMGYLAAVFA